MAEPLDLDALVAWREHCGCHEEYVCVFHQLVEELRATRADWEAEHDKWLDAECSASRHAARAERAEAELENVANGWPIVNPRRYDELKRAEEKVARVRGLEGDVRYSAQHADPVPYSEGWRDGVMFAIAAMDGTG